MKQHFTASIFKIVIVFGAVDTVKATKFSCYVVHYRKHGLALSSVADGAHTEKSNDNLNRRISYEQQH